MSDWHKTTRRDLLIRSAALSAALGFPAIARAETLTKVDVAVTGYDTLYTHTFLAQKAGLFKKYGLETNIINAQSGARIAQMIAAGQATYAMSGIVDPIRLALAGKDTKIIAGFDERVPYANIIIHKDDKNKYHSIADLAGQSIAVTQPQTPMWLMTSYLVERAGVKDKVTIRAAGDFISMLAVVKTKQVPATVATLGMMDTAVSEGWGVPLFNAADAEAWSKNFGGPVPGTACWTLASTTVSRKAETQAVVNALRDAQKMSKTMSAEEIVAIVYDEYFRSQPRDLVIRNIRAYQKGFWTNDNMIDEAAYGRIASLMGSGRMYSDAEMASKANYKAMVDMSFVKASAKL